MSRFPFRGALLVLAVGALVIFVAARGSMNGGDTMRSYSAFERELRAGGIERVEIDGSILNVTPRNGDPYETRLATPPTDLTPFTDAGVDVTVAEPGIAWGRLALFALPIVLMVAFLVFLVRGQRSANGPEGANTFGKSRARMMTEEDTGISFADVAGVEEAKADLEEVVEFLRTPGRFHALGARIPHGVLMVGPPGCGKTHLARAVAGEAGVPFFSISGSDFVEMFVGVGAARVRDLFETAKKSAPCIVFIDEIDAVGRRRGMQLAPGNDEREQTLNALLVEMDGFESDHDIIIMAATNRPDVLDPALLRPGRFVRQVIVDAPDVRGREAILRIHARGKPLARTVDLSRVARRTPGFVGADLENLLNEGALVAARQGRREIVNADLDEAADRVTMGPERRSRVISERERRMTAYHEAGHALAAHLLPHADPVHKITIVPRGRAMGYVMQVPEEDRATASRDELLDRIAVALAGRATEALVLGDVTTGAQNDFRQATDLARRMITRWGMSETLGPVALSTSEDGWLGDQEGARLYGETTATTIDEEIKNLLEREYQRVGNLLEEHREDLDHIVEALLERETLHDEEFVLLLQGEPLPEPPPVHDPELRPSERTAKRSNEAAEASQPTPPGGTAEPG